MTSAKTSSAQQTANVTRQGHGRPEGSRSRGRLFVLTANPCLATVGHGLGQGTGHRAGLAGGQIDEVEGCGDGLLGVWICRDESPGAVRRQHEVDLRQQRYEQLLAAGTVGRTEGSLTISVLPESSPQTGTAAVSAPTDQSPCCAAGRASAVGGSSGWSGLFSRQRSAPSLPKLSSGEE